MIETLVGLLWLAFVAGTWAMASYKGRNRVGWTLLAVVALGLAPLVLLVVGLLPRRVRFDEQGYHPDYKRLAG